MLVYIQTQKLTQNGGAMSQIGEKDWLSALPVVGYEVCVLLNTKQKINIPFARISTDGKMVHVGMIQEPANKDSIPMMHNTLQIPETDIRKISLKHDKFHPEMLWLERPDTPDSAQPPEKYPGTKWLNDLPKSRKCHIFLLCRNIDDCKEVHKGWIEYDGKNIYLNEILSESNGRLETARHDRSLNNVIAVLITVDGQPAQIFARATKTKPRY